jgi:hypothetical protein
VAVGSGVWVESGAGVSVATGSAVGVEVRVGGAEVGVSEGGVSGVCAAEAQALETRTKTIRMKKNGRSVNRMGESFWKKMPEIIPRASSG